jgi:hypothetical protein
MKIINPILTWIMKNRYHQIERFLINPHEVQQEVFFKLIHAARDTEWGKKYGYADITSVQEYRKRVPVSAYEDIFPYIERLMKGEQQILWPSEVKWFSKSSGTTNARSKFIPVTDESLQECHFKGGKDMMTLYVNNFPETKVFEGKGLSIGGTHQVNHLNPATHYGDVSAVIMQNLPVWAQIIRTPPLEVALMSEWESKMEKMAEVTMNENVTSLSGVPTWTIVLIQRILEKTGKKNILEVWPNLELFLHGAVAFAPYRKLFNELIPSPQMHYMETYNASEGFFGLQDDLNLHDEMLLLLDHGVYYEFMPMEEFERDHPKTVELHEVELHKNYAMVISTNAGLWRYLIGDTVKFTSISPYRIKITGRTKHFINAFGEEVVVENAEAAITEACNKTGAIINNFTAAPVYLEAGNKGGHEWLVEFEVQPDSMEKFIQVLDSKLREVNSDYDAKRYKDMALVAPKVNAVPEGTFYNWMKKRGKLGGQNKVPRLSNSREYVEDILEMLQTV